jgi:hypothetical protein
MVFQQSRCHEQSAPSTARRDVSEDDTVEPLLTISQPKQSCCPAPSMAKRARRRGVSKDDTVEPLLTISQPKQSCCPAPSMAKRDN